MQRMVKSPPEYTAAAFSSTSSGSSMGIVSPYSGSPQVTSIPSARMTQTFAPRSRLPTMEASRRGSRSGGGVGSSAFRAMGSVSRQTAAATAAATASSTTQKAGRR